MRTLTFGENRYIVGADVYGVDHGLDHVQQQVEMYIDRVFLRHKSFRQIIKTYADRTGLGGIIILDAHGHVTSETKRWYFSDGERDYWVQNWLNKHDGAAAVICLAVCNPWNVGKIQTRRSAVIHFTQVAYLKSLTRTPLCLYVPGFGYLNSSGMRHRALHQLSNGFSRPWQ